MTDRKEHGDDDQSEGDQYSETSKQSEEDGEYPSFIRQLILPDTHVRHEGLLRFCLEILQQKGALKNEKGLKPLVFILRTAALWQLIALGFGIYLAALLAPLIFSTLLALSVAPWLAFFLGVMATLSLILGTALLLSPPLRILNRFVLEWLRFKQYLVNYSYAPDPSLLNDRHDLFNEFLSWSYVLGLLVGIGFGIYLSTLMIPFLISALAVTLSHGMAVFVGIVAGLVLTLATVYLLAQPAILVSSLRDVARVVFKFIGQQNYFLNIFYLGSLMLGAGLGVYASLSAAPFFMNALLALSLSHGIVIFTTVALSLALISLSSWLSSLVITNLALLISPVSCLIPSATKKDSLLGSGGEGDKPIFEKSASLIALVVSFPSYAHAVLDDYPEESSGSEISLTTLN